MFLTSALVVLLAFHVIVVSAATLCTFLGFAVLGRTFFRDGRAAVFADLVFVPCDQVISDFISVCEHLEACLNRALAWHNCEGQGADVVDVSRRTKTGLASYNFSGSYVFFFP